MKKIFFLLTMLAGITASATVTVTPLSANYSTQAVTFKVEWTDVPTAPYNNRVWIWIDFCPVTGTTPGGFTPATITSPIKTGGNGTVTNATARGFFIEYGATNAGTTVTATLSNAPAGKFKWCVYGSDYPPNATANNGTYTLHGTPPFTLIAANGTTTQTVNESTIATSAVTITPVTLTDKTGCPGVFCIYTGSDLYINDQHLCQQRTSGAKNWEAYITDSRDDKVYRIVQIENTWWFAEDFLLTSSAGLRTCGNVTLYDLSIYVTCPSGWDLPTLSKWLTRFGLDAGFPATSIYGDTGLTHAYYEIVVKKCLTNSNHHVLAKDHTEGHCAVISPSGSNCNQNFMGSSRCIREL